MFQLECWHTSLAGKSKISCVNRANYKIIIPQFPLMFSQTFRKWMQQRPWLYRMLSRIDIMEKGVTSEFMSKYQNTTCLVKTHSYSTTLMDNYTFTAIFLVNSNKCFAFRVK